MAEASVEPSVQYYCHKCDKNITPNENFTCPDCSSGFIEEVTPERSDPQLDDAAVFFSSIFGNPMGAHPLLRMTAGGAQGRQTDSNDASEPSQSSTSVGGAAAPGGRPSRPPFRVELRSMGGGQGAGPPAFDNFLQQLIVSLTGSRMPFPVLNMYGNPGDYAFGGELDNIITQLLNQLEGTGPPPATEEQIEDLNTIQISQEDLDRRAECSVCMEDFSLNETAKKLPCRHLYHTDCIVPWLKLHGTCPICRKNMQGEDTAASEEPNQEVTESSSQNRNTFEEFD